MLAATAPSPIIADVDCGLSSLRGVNIPFVTIEKWQDMDWFYAQCIGPWKGTHKTVIIDDLSAMGEMYLVDAKTRHKNKMQAYGELNDWALTQIHRFRKLAEIGYYVVFLCKEEKIKDHNTGGLIWGPSFPGLAVTGMLDFLVGEVYHFELWTDPNNADLATNTHRVLRTKRTNQIAAGSRFGKLGELELANLTSIYSKMEQDV